MKPTMLALTIGATLLAVSFSGVAFYAVSTGDQENLGEMNTHEHSGADEAALHGGWAGDGDHNGAAGMERPSFSEAQGTMPTDETATALEQVSSISIRSDEDFVPAKGVRSGSGSLSDPYIISGFYVTGDLFIADTDKCVIVKENYIGQQLTLNWNGQCVHAHHNNIKDLRVNENVRRTGFATGGLIELNQIDFLGQLRHYDGEFRNNIVGPYAPEDFFAPVMETVPWIFGTDPRVANIDGFNQGLIHHNTFFGSVDLDLHGHHHGTGFFAPHSHYHGGEEGKGMMHDHTQRWTSVAFTNNKIIDYEGYGLRYEDRNHAGDDRTATSEEEMTLNDDHRHWTHVIIDGNEVEAGQIWIDVFNADDNNHYAENPGWLEVTNNQVDFKARDPNGPYGTPFFGAGTDWYSAIHVNTAKEVELKLVGNKVTFKAAEPSDGLDLYPLDDGYQEYYTGIYLDGLLSSNIVIADNTITGYYYGIGARNFAESVPWSVEGNDFGDAQYGVYYDDSVKSTPVGSDVQSGEEDHVEGDEHDHGDHDP